MPTSRSPRWSGSPTGIQIVVNMAASQREGERTYATLLRACREFLKIEPPLAGIVRRDDQVKEASAARPRC